MTTPTHPDIPSQKIACSVCLKEIPLNLADTPEGADYVGHYCGIECYEEFSVRQKAETSAQSGKDQK